MDEEILDPPSKRITNTSHAPPPKPLTPTTMASSPEFHDVEANMLPAQRKAGEENPLVYLDRHGYLFGKKIAKSLSPYLHGVIYNELNLNWAQVRLDSSNMGMFLELIRHPQFYGKSSNQGRRISSEGHGSNGRMSR